ncbi:MAG: transcriptional regulator [Candidatus Thermoplasmatota archaeon]|nr:transcriptional regulator [Candidatus Thermoplasmatota archaeon]MDA8143973.1 transcriptional regulator [Thermoplasmatales archaeon]
MDHATSLFREIKNDLETVKRHLSIIQTLLREQPVGIIKISHETGIPEHKIRYSLRVLEKEGLIIPSREGAILTPEFVENKDKITEEARELSELMSSVYHDLKNSLVKR